jgi:hypothetical protein
METALVYRVKRLYCILMRKAISVTLREDNLLWLRGQASRTAKGSVSELLDDIVSEARSSGRTLPGSVQSVVGTIDLPEDDPDLSTADGHIRALFAASARKPLLIREPKEKYQPKRRRRG